HFVMASNTRPFGASNRRVMQISRSDGVVTLKLPLFPAFPTTITFLVLRLYFLQIPIQPIEALLPDVAVAFGPVGHFFQRACVDPAVPPLSLPSLRNQAGALKHPEMFRYGRHGHIEGPGEVRY